MLTRSDTSCRGLDTFMHIHMQPFNHSHMCTNAFTVIQITREVRRNTLWFTIGSADRGSGRKQCQLISGTALLLMASTSRRHPSGHQGQGSGQWGLAQLPKNGVGQGGKRRGLTRGWWGARAHEALWCNVEFLIATLHIDMLILHCCSSKVN